MKERADNLAKERADSPEREMVGNQARVMVGSWVTGLGDISAAGYWVMVVVNS